jgi:hypothetical protein
MKSYETIAFLPKEFWRHGEKTSGAHFKSFIEVKLTF